MSFKINWPSVALAVVAIALALGSISGGVTLYALRSSAPNPWTFSLVVGVNLGCLVLFGVSLLKVFGDWKMIITEEEITRPTLFGPRSIRWADVQKVTLSHGASIQIHAHYGTIVVSPGIYHDPDRVFEEIREQLTTGKDEL